MDFDVSKLVVVQRFVFEVSEHEIACADVLRLSDMSMKSVVRLERLAANVTYMSFDPNRSAKESVSSFLGFDDVKLLIIVGTSFHLLLLGMSVP